MRTNKEYRETSIAEDILEITKMNSDLLNKYHYFEQGLSVSKDELEAQIKKEIKSLYEVRDRIKNYGRQTVYTRVLTGEDNEFIIA